MKRNNMKCPFCKRALRIGEWKRYETLSDHTSNPNAITHPLRPTFVCECTQSEGAFWDELGYKYGGVYDRGKSDAIGSHAHKFSLTQNLANKIRPFCSKAKYPYDVSHKIARWLINGIWPILKIMQDKENV